jgi:hypothetical protein
VERAATLEVGVSADAIQSAAQRVFALTSSFGGYVRNSNVSSGGASGGGASFDLRVPASRLQAAIAALSGLGHVRAENQTSADVTEGLAYLDRELAAHRAQRTSLLHQLAAMPEGERATALRTRLREVEADLGELQTQLSSLKARSRYTPLQLQLVAERAAGAGGAVGGDLTPGGAASDAGKVLEAALAVLVIAAAAAVPVIAALLLAWGAARLLRTRSRERALDAR